MKSYTITIKPDDGDGASALVQLEIGQSETLLKQITLIAGVGQSLSNSQLPALDVDALLGIVLPRVAPALAVETAPTTQSAVQSTSAAQSTSAEQSTSPVKSSPAPVREPATSTRTRKAAPRQPKKGGSASIPPAPMKRVSPKKSTLPVPAKERAYRVMPDDFLNTFGKTTIADLASVYDVPAYTVQGWVNTARKQGKLPAAKPRKRR